MKIKLRHRLKREIFIFLSLLFISFSFSLKIKQSILPNIINNNLDIPPPLFTPNNILEPINQNGECPCAISYVCKPCNSIASADFMFPQKECPCAKCPPCPLLSVLHDLGMRKANQDQKIASNTKLFSSKINQYLDLLAKYSNDVVKYEEEAKAKSLLMEEAEIKAMLARKNMINMSERARFIAKMGIVDRIPSIGTDYDSTELLGDKILLPEEITSVKDYIETSLNSNLSPEENNILMNDINKMNYQNEIGEYGIYDNNNPWNINGMNNLNGVNGINGINRHNKTNIDKGVLDKNVTSIDNFTNNELNITNEY